MHVRCTKWRPRGPAGGGIGGVWGPRIRAWSTRANRPRPRTDGAGCRSAAASAFLVEGSSGHVDESVGDLPVAAGGGVLVGHGRGRRSVAEVGQGFCQGGSAPGGEGRSGVAEAVDGLGPPADAGSCPAAAVGQRWLPARDGKSSPWGPFCAWIRRWSFSRGGRAGYGEVARLQCCRSTAGRAHEYLAAWSPPGSRARSSGLAGVPIVPSATNSQSPGPQPASFGAGM